MEARQDVNNTPFILGGNTISQPDRVLLTDSGRATPLVYGTVMAKVLASGKYVPFTDETATDGTAIPRGIYIGKDVPSADLVAGDVTDASILLGFGATVDKNKLVIENSKTLDTVISCISGGTATSLLDQTVEDYLANIGIFAVETTDISGYEN